MPLKQTKYRMTPHLPRCFAIESSALQPTRREEVTAADGSGSPSSWTLSFAPSRGTLLSAIFKDDPAS